MQTVTLQNGLKMPMEGFGVFQVRDKEECKRSVLDAIRAGYRLIDTAASYTNEDAVGEAVREAIAEGICTREELFITSKMWVQDMQNYETAEAAIDASLEKTGLDYLDLYLIHWPVPGCYLGTWTGLEKLLDSGRVLSIGVSNFQIHYLEELKKVSGIIPAVNQIECHPLCYPKELIEYCQSEGIQVQAYARLARGAYLDNDVMCVLGTKYARTPAQIGLRWAIQKGISVIPKSVNPERIASNGNIFDFTIEDEDMAIMDTLNEDLHTSHVPEDLRDVIF